MTVSTRKNVLINLLTVLRRRGIVLGQSQSICFVNKAINLELLREEPKKAVQLCHSELQELMRCPDPLYSVPLALMLPTGARFADVSRILASDVKTLTGEGELTLRIYQTKSIRQRLHQRWLSMMIPRTLLPSLVLRCSVCPPNEPLVQVTYQSFMRYLKRFLANDQVSTYSIRRGVFEQLRQRLDSIEEMQAVTLHFHGEQLRWYLEAPTQKERRTQIYASGWHQSPATSTPVIA